MSEQKKDGEDLAIFWSCFLLNKSIVDKVGFFDENFFPARMEDRDYNERLDIVGIKYCRPYTAHVEHELNGTGKELGRKQNSEWSNFDWAGAMGSNGTYFQKKWGHA